MSIIEEIEKMRLEGRPDQEINLALREQGFSKQEVSEALSQTQIKEAVMSQNQLEAPQPGSTQDYQSGYGNYQQSSQEQLQPSMLPQEQQQEANQQEYQEPQQQQGYGNYQYDQYSSSPNVSTDTITEIVEQIVFEKISQMKTQFEKVLDLKTTLETKLAHMDERLQRIERVIDRLQISILQKVGEYLVNVSDLKKELVETQKSFISSHKHHSESPAHEHHHPHHKK